MASLDEIAYRAKDQFKDADKNQDSKLSREEFSKLKLPNVNEETKRKRL